MESKLWCSLIPGSDLQPRWCHELCVSQRDIKGTHRQGERVCEGFTGEFHKVFHRNTQWLSIEVWPYVLQSFIPSCHRNLHYGTVTEGNHSAVNPPIKLACSGLRVCVQFGSHVKDLWGGFGGTTCTGLYCLLGLSGQNQTRCLEVLACRMNPAVSGGLGGSALLIWSRCRHLISSHSYISAQVHLFIYLFCSWDIHPV